MEIAMREKSLGLDEEIDNYQSDQSNSIPELMDDLDDLVLGENQYTQEEEFLNVRIFIYSHF